MNQVAAWIDYLWANPRLAFGIVVAVASVYALLQRRTRLIREDDARFKELREERGDVYRGLRPPTG